VSEIFLFAFPQPPFVCLSRNTHRGCVDTRGTALEAAMALEPTRFRHERLCMTPSSITQPRKGRKKNSHYRCAQHGSQKQPTRFAPNFIRCSALCAASGYTRIKPCREASTNVAKTHHSPVAFSSSTRSPVPTTIVILDTVVSWVIVQPLWTILCRHDFCHQF
jgi:hypothetical protein